MDFEKFDFLIQRTLKPIGVDSQFSTKCQKHQYFTFTTNCCTDVQHNRKDIEIKSLCKMFHEMLFLIGVLSFESRNRRNQNMVYGTLVHHQHGHSCSFFFNSIYLLWLLSKVNLQPKISSIDNDKFAMMPGFWKYFNYYPKFYFEAGNFVYTTTKYELKLNCWFWSLADANKMKYESLL